MGLLSKGKGLVQTSWSSGVHKLIADRSNWQQNDSGKLGFNFNESHDLQWQNAVKAKQADQVTRLFVCLPHRF